MLLNMCLQNAVIGDAQSLDFGIENAAGIPGLQSLIANKSV